MSLGILAAAAGLAQVDPPGGIDLGFSIGQNVIVSDNAALDPDPQGTTLRADTQLGFRLSSETRIDTLALTGSTTYRYADGPGISESDFTDPVFTLDYARQGANSAASANLSYRSSDIAFDRLTVDPTDPRANTNLVQGTGDRVDIAASASLALGQQGPFGANLTIGASETDYTGVSDPTIVDVSRRNASLDLRFALTDTTDATARLGYSQIDPDGPDLFETTSLDLGASIQQRAGSLSVSAGYADTESGARYNLSVGRQITLPRGTIAASLGASRDPGGETALSGGLSVQRQLKSGALGFALDRSNRTTDQGERLVTSLSATYARPLTNRVDLGLDAAYVLSEDTAADTEETAADIGATVGYRLTEDWAVSLGYQYRTRSRPGGRDAAENALSLGLSRNFTIGVR